MQHLTSLPCLAYQHIKSVLKRMVEACEHTVLPQWSRVVSAVLHAVRLLSDHTLHPTNLLSRHVSKRTNDVEMALTHRTPVEHNGRIGHPRAPMPWPLCPHHAIEEDGDATEE